MTTFESLRRKNALTQADVASALNISRTAVYKWEAGKSLPLSRHLPALARIFHCTVDDLLKEEEE